MDRALLRQRFGVLHMEVKKFVCKGPKASVTNYMMKIADKMSNVASNVSSDAEEDAKESTELDPIHASSTSTRSDTSELASTEPKAQQEIDDIKRGDSADNDCDHSGESSESRDIEKAEILTVEKLNKHWKAMRNPPEGHVHNVYCPFWRSRDSSTPRPECLDRAYTLLSGNPFTRDGATYLEIWEAQYKRNRNRGREENHLGDSG
ncbi:hypothetical protein N0V90_012505 [Kalmusia sp. IMI 367209]|nr:hypothetical protein N0V90_012505 [Kalmusia sp. IMI 367209]